MSHIGHKYNNVQADGGVALRVDLFESNKQKTTKLMNKVKSSNITDYTQSA
jgi:hypothetical protein